MFIKPVLSYEKYKASPIIEIAKLAVIYPFDDKALIDLANLLIILIYRYLFWFVELGDIILQSDDVLRYKNLNYLYHDRL
jgi:hypothetical protein